MRRPVPVSRSMRDVLFEVADDAFHVQARVLGGEQRRRPAASVVSSTSNPT